MSNAVVHSMVSGMLRRGPPRRTLPCIIQHKDLDLHERHFLRVDAVLPSTTTPPPTPMLIPATAAAYARALL